MPSPITNLASLKAAVTDYLERPDLEPWYDTFIPLAEARMNAVLKAPGAQTFAVLELTGADLTAAVPDDFVEWVALRWLNSGASQSLLFVEPNSPEFRHRYRPGGYPQFYTVSGGRIRLVPAKAGQVELLYYRRVPPLLSSTTNWLLQQAPHLYLYTVLAEAYGFQKDATRAAEWTKMADEQMMRLISGSSTGKVGRRPERPAEDAAAATAAKGGN